MVMQGGAMTPPCDGASHIKQINQISISPIIAKWGEKYNPFTKMLHFQGKMQGTAWVPFPL
jgi:hypothetical protein